MNDNHSITDALIASKVYGDYRKAFNQATGLPLALRSLESWKLPQRGSRYENAFCALMARQSRSCSNCLRIQQKLSDHAVDEPYTATCSAGLCETAVPVKVGESVIALLQTGQVFRQAPSDEQFDRIVALLGGWKVDTDAKELKERYFQTRVVPFRQYASTVGLLHVFAEHLSILGNQLLVQKQTAEPPLIIRAKQFIDERYNEDLSLEQVAKSVHTSTFYFCKLFKKMTGENFTDYLSRVRIAKAKNLLLNPDLRIGEIAYEVGFQSLTHFNRVFKKVLGVAPTEYRKRLPAG